MITKVNRQQISRCYTVANLQHTQLIYLVIQNQPTHLPLFIDSNLISALLKLSHITLSYSAFNSQQQKIALLLSIHFLLRNVEQYSSLTVTLEYSLI